MPRHSTVAVVALTLLASCGGDDGGSAVSAASVEDCLRDQPAPYSTDTEDMDVLAEEAGDGAFVLDLDPNEAIIVVERSEGDADRTREQYELFDVGGDLVAQEGNALVVYSKSPSDSDREAAEGCL